MEELVKHLIKTLDRLESKQDQTGARLTNIDLTLANQNAVLQDHTRRSLANEQLLETVRAELAPLKQHVVIWGAVGKLIGFIGTMVGIIAAVCKMLGWY